MIENFYYRIVSYNALTSRSMEIDRYYKLRIYTFLSPQTVDYFVSSIILSIKFKKTILK